MCKVKLVKSFTGHICIEGSCRSVVKVLTHLKEAYGRDTSDINDALRILNNFNSFYDMMKRKFKDFVSPKKDEGDLIKGLVTVDKIKLFKKDGAELVQLIFDKRIGLDFISKVLMELGIDFEVIQE